VRLHLASGQTLGDQRDDQVLYAGQAPLALAHDPGRKRGVAVAWHLQVDRADLGQHRLGPGAVAGVGAVAAGRIAVGIAEVVGELTLKRTLQHQLDHLLQQPVRADQADPPLAGLGDQPRSQLLIDRVQLGSRRVQGLRVLGRRLRHLASPPVCHRHTLSWSYTVVFTVPTVTQPRTSGYVDSGHGQHVTSVLRSCRTGERHGMRSFT
jgi:hypothetical protein